MSERVEQFIEVLADHQCEPRVNGDAWQARCPAHDDRTASLSIGTGNEGRVLVHCHAGCTVDAVCRAVGKNVADLMPPSPAKRNSTQRRIAAEYDYLDESGALVFQAVRFEPKDFRQRKPDGNGGWSWSVKGVRIIPFRLPELIAADSRQWVFVVEGEKDVLNLNSIGAIATCNAAGAGKWRPEHAAFLRDRKVCVLPDNDDPGRKHGQQVARSLHGIAELIRIVELPGLKEKGDVSDWIDAGGTRDELLAMAESSVDWRPSPDSAKRELSSPTGFDDPRTVSIDDEDEATVADNVIARLEKLTGTESIYHRGGILVSVVPVEDKDLPSGILRIIPLALPTLRERITVAVRLVREKTTQKGVELVSVPPPKWLPEAIAARKYYPAIRVLSGIIQSPTLRHDGSILQVKGYDTETGLLYSPLTDFPLVPESPSRAEIETSVAQLLDVVFDFPFVSRADQSAWLAMVLTMVGRMAIDGCCPLFAPTSNTRGSGKSLLVDAGSIIAYGRPAARETFTSKTEELRKRITSIALEAKPFVLFDNIDTDTKLASAILDAAITSRIWTDRLLGKNSTVGELPIRTVWAATGNNLLFGGDTARRVLPIRLESPLENPEDRQGFRHPELLSWVLTRRAELATAALTILRGYFVAGCPSDGGAPWGSFEGWHRVIRGAIVWAGLADPTATRETARDQDETSDLVRNFINGLLEADPDRDGLTVRDIGRLVAGPDAEKTCPTLCEAVSQVCGDKFDSRRIAGRLRTFAGRVVGGNRIQSIPGRSNVKKWTVEAVNGGFGGDGGFPLLSYAWANSQTNDSAYGEGLNTNPPNQSNQPSAECKDCGTLMDSTPAEHGWRNWDCPNCGAVTPAREGVEA